METTTDRQAVLVVTAAGSSQRMGGGAKKEFLRLPSGLSVLAGAIEPFVRSLTLCACVVTYKSGDHGALEQAHEAIRTSRLLRETFDGGGVPLILTEGGKDRQESVYNGLEALQAANIANLASDTIVLVHDGARPFVTEPLIEKRLRLRARAAQLFPRLSLPTRTKKSMKTEKSRAILTAAGLPRCRRRRRSCFFRCLRRTAKHAQAEKHIPTTLKSGMTMPRLFIPCAVRLQTKKSPIRQICRRSSR